MNQYSDANRAYTESSVLTAPPERLVVMLYDGAVRFLNQASTALRAGNQRVFLQRVQRERELIAAGDWQGVATLGTERDRVVETLPEPAPAAAAPLLHRALAEVRANLATAVATRDHTRATLAHMAEGRRALRAYAGSPPSAHVDAHS